MQKCKNAKTHQPLLSKNVVFPVQRRSSCMWAVDRVVHESTLRNFSPSSNSPSVILTGVSLRPGGAPCTRIGVNSSRRQLTCCLTTLSASPVSVHSSSVLFLTLGLFSSVSGAVVLDIQSSFGAHAARLLSRSMPSVWQYLAIRSAGTCFVSKSAGFSSPLTLLTHSSWPRTLPCNHKY